MEETGKAFGTWLQSKFVEYIEKQSIVHGKIPSQNQWAQHLKISPNNLSQYMQGNRRPNAEQADILAAALGPEVYDRLGMPRKMPKNKDLYFVADHWSDLTIPTSGRSSSGSKAELPRKGRNGGQPKTSPEPDQSGPRITGRAFLARTEHLFCPGGE